MTVGKPSPAGPPRSPRGTRTGYAILSWLVALHLSWLALAAVDFGYPLWHDLIGIDHTIARFGPENRYRSGFESTTRAERVRLFAAINAAIHDAGAGLAELRYHDPSGRPLGRLLRTPEIVHLQDVARLVALGRWLGWLALGGWLLASGWLLRRRCLPRPRALALRLAAVLGTGVVLVLVIGPTRVFYQFHIWLFPPDHPWFFYYQDSLMTTMMQAPDLFGWIALALLLLSLLLLAGLWMLGDWVQRRPGAQSGRLSMGTGTTRSAGSKPKIRP